MDQTDSVNADPHTPDRQERFAFCRNISGFWLLGLCNNFAYVVMLSAAHDILKQQENHNTTLSASPTGLYSVDGGNSTSNGTLYDCNPTSTAAVLLADILPTLIIKAVAPFVIHKLAYGFRVLTCVATAAGSFLLVSFSSTVAMSLLGVIFASIGSGLGELSFLSLTVYFSRSVLNGWSSGTGFAGVAGAFLYSGLTQLGWSPRVTLLWMLISPVTMAVSYFLLLVFPPSFPQWQCIDMRVGDDQARRSLIAAEVEEDCEPDTTTGRNDSSPLTFKEKRVIFKGLLKFIIPLGLVYFAEYFINQGLLELLYFPGFILSHAEQYRWYQSLYQIGVFLSRSSLFCVKIRKIWIMSVLQCANALFLALAVYWRFLPSAGLVFAIVVYEGLLGGTAYANTFYFISVETADKEREFAMAAASVGDSVGIAMSAILSFPVHNYFCSL